MNQDEFVKQLSPYLSIYVSSDEKMTLDSISKVSFSGNQIYEFCEKYHKSKEKEEENVRSKLILKLESIIVELERLKKENKKIKRQYERLCQKYII